jgi:hypothetical protein
VKIFEILIVEAVSPVRALLAEIPKILKRKITGEPEKSIIVALPGDIHIVSIVKQVIDRVSATKPSGSADKK